ncbi:MAG: hypothetical protein D6675_03985 [Gemmatimonadetes bacterium]|nr:MAG: hypothetical protein D6675_03985 [Gemmatimonadota bacterium]
MRPKVIPEMTPAEIMELYPEAEAVFEAYFMAESHLDPELQHESLEECALREEVDLDDLMEELNQILRDAEDFYVSDEDEDY